MKHIEKRPMDRKTRKGYFVKMGEERFGFVESEEFLKYKYLCGEKIGIIEWYMRCQKGFMPYSYQQWEQSIKKEYGNCTREQLIEFEKYLELGVLKYGVYKALDNIVNAALVSSFLAVIFSEIVVGVVKQGNYFSAIIILILILFGFVIIVIMVHNSIKRKVLKERMYQDYKKVIESMRA